MNKLVYCILQLVSTKKNDGMKNMMQPTEELSKYKYREKKQRVSELSAQCTPDGPDIHLASAQCRHTNNKYTRGIY